MQREFQTAPRDQQAAMAPGILASFTAPMPGGTGDNHLLSSSPPSTRDARTHFGDAGYAASADTFGSPEEVD